MNNASVVINHKYRNIRSIEPPQSIYMFHIEEYDWGPCTVDRRNEHLQPAASTMREYVTWHDSKKPVLKNCKSHVHVSSIGCTMESHAIDYEKLHFVTLVSCVHFR